MNDAYSGALEGRKKKLLSIEISVGDPQKVGLAPGGEPKDPMAVEEEDAQIAAADEPVTNPAAMEEDPEILAAMRGGRSDEQNLEELEGREPKSLGERVRLLLAKKK